MAWLPQYRAPDFPGWRDVCSYTAQQTGTINAGNTNILLGAFAYSLEKDIYLFQIDVVAWFMTQGVPNFIEGGWIQLAWNFPSPPSKWITGATAAVNPAVVCKSGEHRSQAMMREIPGTFSSNLFSGIAILDAAAAANITVRIYITLFYLVTN